MPETLPRPPHPLMVKCVAVIREFYKQAVRAEVVIKGRSMQSAQKEQQTSETVGVTKGFISSAASSFLLNLMLLTYVAYCLEKSLL